MPALSARPRWGWVPVRPTPRRDRRRVRAAATGLPRVRRAGMVLPRVLPVVVRVRVVRVRVVRAADMAVPRVRPVAGLQTMARAARVSLEITAPAVRVAPETTALAGRARGMATRSTATSTAPLGETDRHVGTGRAAAAGLGPTASAARWGMA